MRSEHGLLVWQKRSSVSVIRGRERRAFLSRVGGSGEQEGRQLDVISSLDRWKVANVLTGEWQCESNGAATEVTRCVRRRCEE